MYQVNTWKSWSLKGRLYFPNFIGKASQAQTGRRSYLRTLSHQVTECSHEMKDVGNSPMGILV